MGSNPSPPSPPIERGNEESHGNAVAFLRSWIGGGGTRKVTPKKLQSLFLRQNRTLLQADWIDQQPHSLESDNGNRPHLGRVAGCFLSPSKKRQNPSR